MNSERPDLSQIEPAVRAYIEALEAELARLRPDKSDTPALAPLEPSEPPTSLNVITISAGGQAKRTPRHLYLRQRRGGMGVFDLETTEADPPAYLVIADENQSLLLITSQARLFRLPVSALPESPLRSRGQRLIEGLPLRPEERLAVALPHQSSGYCVLVTEQGQVRRLRYNYLGADGSSLIDLKEGGVPVAGCWSGGEDDLLIATRQGKAIRFAEQRVPHSGCLGLRLEPGDAVVAVAPVQETSGVFLLSADGKGSIRQMSGFAANKAPGAGGKVVLKTEQLTGVVTVGETDDLFIISRQGKIIRFAANEVPPKEGVVQGVNCMTFRADETVAVGVGRVTGKEHLL